MNTFQFEKSLLVRLEESENVLKGKNSLIPASAVRSEWAYHIELQIEPAGLFFNLLNLLFFFDLILLFSLLLIHRLASIMENFSGHL